MTPDERADWLISRRSGIGGSDVAKILGIAPKAWGGPVAVWADKVYDYDIAPDNLDRLDAGSDAEQYLAARFAREHTGLRVGCEQVRVTSLDHGWAFAHVDGLVFAVDPDEPPFGPVGPESAPLAVWEAKTAHDWTEWNVVPAYYQAQAQWAMWCADLPRCYVTVGFSGWKSRTYIVDRDQEDIDTIVKACSTFWHDHVLTGIMPPVDDSPDTARILRMIHQADPGRVVTAPSAVAGYIEILRNVKADIKALEERKTMLDNLIMAALGDATELVDPAGDLLATWRQSKDGTVFDMDRFRIDHPEMVATYQKIKHGNRPLLIKPIKGE